MGQVVLWGIVPKKRDKHLDVSSDSSGENGALPRSSDLAYAIGTFPGGEGMNESWWVT